MPDSSPDDVVSTDTTITTTTDTPAVAGAPDGTTAASSTTETKPAETLLDRVKALSNTAHKEGSPTSEKPGVTADADSTSKKVSSDSDELTEDELKGLHAKTRERLSAFKSKLEAKDTEIASLAPKAAEYDKIDTFIKNAGLSSQDVGSTLEIAAMLRSDPAAARTRLQPIMAELDRILGEVLPAELQTRVDQGYLTLEDAQELARSKATAKLATDRVAATTEAQRRDEAAREQQAQTTATVTSVETWEKQKAANDPDWHTKRAEVAEQVEIAIERKTRELKRPYFPTPQEAIALSNDAVKTVEDRHKRFTPKLKAIDPPAGHGASPRSTPAPKSTLDIIKRITGGATA